VISTAAQAMAAHRNSFDFILDRDWREGGRRRVRTSSNGRAARAIRMVCVGRLPGASDAPSDILALVLSANRAAC
jgi:hypothetical protein